jgi:NADH dehydrogenase
VVAAAARAQVKKFVLVSFLKARPSKTSRYLDTKWKAEEIVRNSGLDFTIVKPGMVYGKGDQMITNIVDGLRKFPVVGFWPTVGLMEKTVNPLYIDDFVRILIAALLEERMIRQTIGVFGPDYITLTKAVFRVAAVMGKPVLPVPMPVLGQYLVAFGMERMMKNPLVTMSQIRMLADGMDEPTPESDLPPTDLHPQTMFTPESIKASFDF